jgi:hypothetical protein
MQTTPTIVENLCLLVRDRDLNTWVPVRLSDFEVVSENDFKTVYRLTFNATSQVINVGLTVRSDNQIRVRPLKGCECLTPHLVQVESNDPRYWSGFESLADLPEIKI